MVKEQTNEDKIDQTISLRSDIAVLIDTVKEFEKQLGAPGVQEAVLSRRHLEDARMRLGMVLGYLES